MNTLIQNNRLSNNLAAPVCLLLLLATQGAAVAQSFSITNVAVPGADSLTVNALNLGGRLAGTYYTGSTPHAFVWENGVADGLNALGGTMSEAFAINRLNQVVGDAATVGDAELHGFLAVGHTLFDLGTLGGANSLATSVSDSGYVVGYSEIVGGSVDFHAFLRAGSGLIDLGTLGGSLSSASAVNNVGRVIGDSTIAGDLENHAFFYDGTLHDLGTFGGSYSTAAALNDSGLVTGESGVSAMESHAFLFDGTTVHDLGTLGGTFSSGYSINEAGDVAGDSLLAGDAQLHSFLYHAGVMQDLGTLGGTRSSAAQINNAGQIVGASEVAGGDGHAFLWQAGVMRDLNTMLPANSGWVLTDAYFINDNGQISGVGSFQGVVTWYLLTPRSQQNQPPVANAGPDQTVPSTSTSALVTLNGSGSSDPDGDTLQFQWFEGAQLLGEGATSTVTLALGAHTITLRVIDPSAASADDTVVVTVVDAAPPVFACPADQTASAGANGQTAVPDLLANLIATDNGTPAENLLKTQNPAAGTLLPCGNHPIVVTVADAAGNAASCMVGFAVVDVTPPVVQAPASVPVPSGSDCRAVVPDFSSVITASDNCTANADLRVSQEPAAGTTITGSQEVRVTVADQAGNATTVAVALEVADVTPPVINAVKANPCEILQTNRKMVPVKICVEAVDSCDPAPRSRIVSVTSSDPVIGHSDSTWQDWNVTGDLTLEVRAEVASSQTPRIYTICVACTDASGNTSKGHVKVQVSR
ncbi:MAG TPA: HYR domain-containing protein [Verrucomicrobiae bacterium]|nr:HYR domain-containing protein [Verrucomicrobiae bacterium]